jgi:hypothetical protein
MTKGSSNGKDAGIAAPSVNIHYCAFMYIVTCYPTKDAVQTVNSFYYNLTSRNYNHLLDS